MIAFHEIRHKRIEKGLSQSKLSKLLGITQATLSQWELKKESVSNAMLSQINAVLDSISENEIIQMRKKRYINHGNGTIIKRDIELGRQISYGYSEENYNYVKLLAQLEQQRKSGHPPSDSPRAISLFSGCGGFSLGFTWAGFNVKGFVELQPGFRRIYSSNFIDTSCLGQDISIISDEDIRTWCDSLGPIDVVFGGPPCQGFSLSGKRDHYDPRNQLFRHFARVVSIIRPKAVLLENVRLLTSMKSPSGGFFKDEIVSEFSKIGYDMSFAELNAKNYGVPQNRERVFFLGLLKTLEAKPSFPTPTHSFSPKVDLFSATVRPYRTFKDATVDLERIESGEKSQNDRWHFAVAHPEHVILWLQNVPEGASAHENLDLRMRPPSGYNTTYKRLKWDEPASTVSTTFGMISGSRNVHPQSTRSLTIREALRCQSFPDTFMLDGSLGEIRTSIGNAVPPLLAKSLAEHVKQLLRTSTQTSVSCKSTLLQD